MIIDQSIYQLVKCAKNGKLYSLAQTENFWQFQDYSMVKCYPMDEAGELMQKEVLIYRKDLMVGDESRWGNNISHN